MRLEAKLTISGPGSGDDRHVEVAVVDTLSGNRALTLTIPLEKWARILLGEARLSVDAEWATEYIGKYRVFKQAVVADGELDLWTVDGWQHASGYKNHRTLVKGIDRRAWRVSFVRWVDVLDETYCGVCRHSYGDDYPETATGEAMAIAEAAACCKRTPKD